MLVVNGDGTLRETCLADSWDAQVAAVTLAESVGGLVAAVPILHDFRPEPAGG